MGDHPVVVSIPSNLESKTVPLFHRSLVCNKRNKNVDARSKRADRLLIGLAIESTLLQKGRSAFETVENIFQERYNCTIMDAYDNPQHLNEVLKEVFGTLHPDVIRSIELFLKDFRCEQPIEEFIGKMNG